MQFSVSDEKGLCSMRGSGACCEIEKMQKWIFCSKSRFSNVFQLAGYYFIFRNAVEIRAILFLKDSSIIKENPFSFFTLHCKSRLLRP